MPQYLVCADVFLVLPTLPHSLQQTHTNHSASHDSVVGEVDSNMLAFVTANLSNLLHLGCLKNSKGHRCFGVLYSYQVSIIL